MKHLRRTATVAAGTAPPVWKAWRGLLYVVGGQLLARAGHLWNSHHSQKLLHTALAVVGLVVQMVLLLVAAYMVDLCISLMELWADLAQKHLEITL